MCVCARAHVCICVRVCVSARVWVCVCVGDVVVYGISTLLNAANEVYFWLWMIGHIYHQPSIFRSSSFCLIMNYSIVIIRDVALEAVHRVNPLVPFIEKSQTNASRTRFRLVSDIVQKMIDLGQVIMLSFYSLFLYISLFGNKSICCVFFKQPSNQLINKTCHGYGSGYWCSCQFIITNNVATIAISYFNFSYCCRVVVVVVLVAIVVKVVIF